MVSFIGNIDAKVDAKGRIFLPSTYRRLLPDEERERVVIRKDPDNDCIVLYPEGVWNKKLTELKDRLDEWNSQDQLLLMQFVSDAEWLDIDSQGRILISKRYLHAIEATTDVVFVGMLDRIAIWNPKKYEAAKFNEREFAQKLSEKMMRREL